MHTDLVSLGSRDTLAMHLAREVVRLLASIPEPPLFPARREFESSLGRKDSLIDVAIVRGVHALKWLVHERGLGGGRELDGPSFLACELSARRRKAVRAVASSWHRRPQTIYIDRTGRNQRA